MRYLQELDSTHMKDPDKAALILSILPDELMGDVIREVTNRKNPTEVETEIERILQALEDIRGTWPQARKVRRPSTINIRRGKTERRGRKNDKRRGILR